MAFTTGLEGLLSSTSTGTDLKWLIDTSTKPYNATINLILESLDTSGFSSTPPVATSKTPGINSWTGSFNARFPRSTPASGHEGLVTFSSGYVKGVSAWSISATAESHKVTEQSTTPPTWESFLSGKYSFSGSWDCLIDDTTAVSLPTSGAASFRLSTETTNDNVLAGNIIVTGASPTVDLAGKNVMRYTFDVDGNLTTDGDSSFLEVALAGTPDSLVRPEETAIVLQASGSRTYTGNAFLTGWTVGASIGSAIETSVSLQGTGALVAN